ncbi:uncharacterized protein A1O9_12545 [Exophiala aquamarina CBS 119918]|uniref:ER membrane protein complex subunit 2 n=1 Tax=Exophiala aquamarina CBS 119918 TaxID=1182545 RepID=A0A072NUU6_9EURO|nr:uncharacterized protein A1O9_12545 [Exophiala aquamarina CBS 119918]KEF51396.1 hypothetical protein A1O9_12545 [Exophiala aquamarina CBS 119918]
MTTAPQHSSDPAAALQVAQQASSILAKSSSVSATFPASLFSRAETPELWTELEQLLYACLRTGDDKSAFLCLEKLGQRFGADNDRVMALRGLYQEAVAEDDEALRKILEDYNKILMENPMNVPIHKRRIALIKGMGRRQGAIANLVDFLESFPTDVEGWSELSDLYYSEGLVSQAIFSMEEAIVITPNAWNLHARLGELQYMAGCSTSDNAEVQKHLTQAIQRFSRSIELCDDYLRGFYGLKLASDKLLQASGSTKGGSAATISPENVQKLNQLATSRLQALVKDRATHRSLPGDQSGVVAAQELLNRSK